MAASTPRTTNRTSLTTFDPNSNLHKHFPAFTPLPALLTLQPFSHLYNHKSYLSLPVHTSRQIAPWQLLNPFHSIKSQSSPHFPHGLCIFTSARSTGNSFSMDFIFYLDGHSLQEIMRSIVVHLEWTYIVLWSLDQPPQELACKDGWFNPEMETGSSMAPSQSVGQTLFNLYKLCRFALDAGVPGLALSQPPYVWLTANELLRFSSNESQEVFYMAAGIQTAVFIPCGIGVVELGTTKLVQQDEQNKLRFSSLLANVIVSPNISVPMPMPIPETSILTPSCSSLLSRSIDSHESSSNVPYLQPLQWPSSSGLLTGGFDLEISSAQLSVPGVLIFPQTSQASGFPVAPSTGNMMMSAFDIWRLPSNTRSQPVVEGQYRLKRSLAILRNIHAERMGQISMSGSERPPGGTVSSGQIHHLISERRRREKLREKFDALRTFIPRGARKDKASILGYTREYLISLKSRVEELEERNKELESELKKLPRAQSKEGAAISTALQQCQEGTGTSKSLQQQGSTGSEGRKSVVTVEVSKIGGSASTASSDEMANIAAVVDNPRNTIDSMVAMLESLREMRVPLVSMATSTAHHEHDESHLRYRMIATIKLQDHDTEQVRESLVSMVREASEPRP